MSFTVVELARQKMKLGFCLACSTTACIITYAYYVRLDHVFICHSMQLCVCTLLSDGDLVVSVD